MIKIRAINKYDPKEIINAMLEGAEIYRINFESTKVIRLKDKTIDRLLKDEKTYPNQYGYFRVIPDEPSAIEEIDDLITGIEENIILNPPSAKLRLAAGAYGIETQGMTTRQIITSILANEAIERQETKC